MTGGRVGDEGEDEKRQAEGAGEDTWENRVGRRGAGDDTLGGRQGGRDGWGLKEVVGGG